MSLNTKKLSFLLLITGLALVSATAVFAQDATPAAPGLPAAVSDDEVNAIAKGMYCPVCENIPLDVCGTQACHQWRELIRLKLAEGWNEQEIKAYFVEQYGDRVLSEPPRRGLNWLIYIIPPLIVLGGLILVIQVLRTWQKPATQTTAAAGPEESLLSQDEYVRRLEEELRRRD